MYVLLFVVCCVFLFVVCCSLFGAVVCCLLFVVRFWFVSGSLLIVRCSLDVVVWYVL